MTTPFELAARAMNETGQGEHGFVGSNTMSCSYWSGPCMCRDECAKLGCRDARPVAARAHGEIMTDEKQGRATPPVPDDEHAAFVTWWDSPTRDVSEDQSARRGAWAGWRASALATRAAPPEPPADVLRDCCDRMILVHDLIGNDWMPKTRATLVAIRAALASQSEQVAPLVEKLRTPDSTLPPLGEGPRRYLTVTVQVPADWSNGLAMQWILEREIHADRWSWNWADAAPPAPAAQIEPASIKQEF